MRILGLPLFAAADAAQIASRAGEIRHAQDSHGAGKTLCGLEDGRGGSSGIGGRRTCRTRLFSKVDVRAAERISIRFILRRRNLFWQNASRTISACGECSLTELQQLIRLCVQK